MALIDDLLVEKIKIESFLVSSAGQKLPDNLLERLETLKTLLGEIAGGSGSSGTVVLAVFRATGAGTGYSTNDIITLRQTAPDAPVYYNATTNATIPTPSPTNLGSVNTASNVTVATSLPAGSNNIGTVGVSGTIPVSLATLPVTNAGIFAVQAASTLAAETTKVIGTVNVAGTIPVSGTVTANTGLSQPLTDTQLRNTPVPVSFGALPTGANAIGSITNTSFAATQSGAWNLTVKSLAFTSTATITRAATTEAYLANDQYGGTFQLSGFGSANGSVFLTDVRIIFNIAALPVGMAGLQLYLFSVTPPSSRTDNATFSLPAGDRASCLTPNGIDMTARLALGGGSVIAVANNVNRKYLVPSSGNVFGCLVTLAALPTIINPSETASILCETVEA